MPALGDFSGPAASPEGRRRRQVACYGSLKLNFAVSPTLPLTPKLRSSKKTSPPFVTDSTVDAQVPYSTLLMNGAENG